jgi:hypothetical protein
MVCDRRSGPTSTDLSRSQSRSTWARSVFPRCGQGGENPTLSAVDTPVDLVNRGFPADTEYVDEPAAINWDDVRANLDVYPWVVWEIMVRDPREVLAHADVPELTRVAATEAARLYGCVYEYCVDDDNLPDGTKYYKWYIGVKQSENRQRVGQSGSEPQVVAELLGALLSVLPKEFDDNTDLWTRGPSLYPTYVRNEIDEGYSPTEIAFGTTDFGRS